MPGRALLACRAAANKSDITPGPPHLVNSEGDVVSLRSHHPAVASVGKSSSSESPLLAFESDFARVPEILDVSIDRVMRSSHLTRSSLRLLGHRWLHVFLYVAEQLPDTQDHSCWHLSGLEAFRGRELIGPSLI